MTPPLLYLGFTYKTTPIDVRERLCLDPDAQQALLDRLSPLAAERFVIATCGRFEIYATRPDAPASRLHDAVADFCHLDVKTLRRFARVLRNEPTARHLFRVAAGLESQSLGEPNILNQLRTAFERARRWNCLGPTLSTLVQTAIHTGKRVRRDTRIGDHRTSLGAQAVDALTAQLPKNQSNSILIVGAGSMAREALAKTASNPRITATIANRDIQHAQELANRFGITVVPFERLPGAVAHADGIIVCTSAPRFLVDRAMLAALPPRRRVIVDMSVPRNVDPNVATLDGVELIHLDQVATQHSPGESELSQAERIIDRQLKRLLDWYAGHLSAARIQTVLTHRTRVDARPDPIDRQNVHRRILRIKHGRAA